MAMRKPISLLVLSLGGERQNQIASCYQKIKLNDNSITMRTFRQNLELFSEFEKPKDQKIRIVVHGNKRKKKFGAVFLSPEGPGKTV